MTPILTPDPSPAGSRVAFSDPQVNLYAGDIEASVRFYRDVIGFSETFRIPKEGVPRHVELKLGSLRLGAASYEALAHDHGIRTGKGSPRLELALFTDDVDGAFEWATSHAAPGLRPPGDFGGYIHNARVADPDGNPIVFTTPLPVRVAPDPAHRPKFKNHLVNILTRDLEKSLRFYRDALGFAETYRTPQSGSPEHVELELGRLNLGISTFEALQRHHGISGGEGPPRGEVVLWAANTDAALAGLNERGVPTLSPAHNFAGTLRGAWVSDPDGNPVQLVSRISSA